MRVTNEKLTADVACANRETCDGCEYKRRNCVDDRERNDYAHDLLEARELIKEMRNELEDAKTVMEKYESQLTGELFNDPSLNAILDKSKDYA